MGLYPRFCQVSTLCVCPWGRCAPPLGAEPSACAAPNPRRTDLGVCAEALRKYFCGGADAAMTRPDLMNKMFPAFANLDVRGPARTDALRRKWAGKLSVSEFADELAAGAVDMRRCSASGRRGRHYI